MSEGRQPVAAANGCMAAAYHRPAGADGGAAAGGTAGWLRWAVLGPATHAGLTQVYQTGASRRDVWCFVRVHGWGCAYSLQEVLPWFAHTSMCLVPCACGLAGMLCSCFPGDVACLGNFCAEHSVACCDVLCQQGRYHRACCAPVWSWTSTSWPTLSPPSSSICWGTMPLRTSRTSCSGGVSWGAPSAGVV